MQESIIIFEVPNDPIIDHFVRLKHHLTYYIGAKPTKPRWALTFKLN